MADDVIARINDEVRDIYALQHFLMQHPDLPVSYYGGREAHVHVPYTEDEDGIVDYDKPDLAKVADLVRMMKDGGTVDKTSTEQYMTYTRTLGKKAKVRLVVERSAVCTAKVVGTVTVEHAAVPAYTETKDVIEWECAPILAEAEA